MKTVQSLLETANAVVPRVSPEETERLLAAGQALVVDVRDEPEIAATGCIPGAIHVSRGMLEFRADPGSPYHNPAFDTERTVILYCASGGRSALAGQALKELGYRDVRNLGGLKEWTESGRPVEPLQSA